MVSVGVMRLNGRCRIYTVMRSSTCQHSYSNLPVSLTGRVLWGAICDNITCTNIYIEINIYTSKVIYLRLELYIYV
jgi:hypothetical protein